MATGYAERDDGLFYKKHPDWLSFHDTQTLCRSEGADVPTFRNERELAAMRGTGESIAIEKSRNLSMD